MPSIRQCFSGGRLGIETPQIAPTKPTKAPPLVTAALPTACAKSLGANVSEWNQAASDVLNILVHTGQPVPHPQIVRGMAFRQYPKKAACEAIAFCQSRGWIEHNLVSGYVLSGMTESEGAGG